MEIITNGIKINYKVFGEGKPFLILHGWGSSSEKWQRIGELLAKNNFKVIVPDLPGFGKSQQPQSSWNLDDYCNFVSEFAKACPELAEGFYLLGHSFGGAIAAKFSIRYPQNIEKLFLVAAACVRKKTAKKQLFFLLSKIVKIFSFVPFYDFFRKAVYKYIIKKSDYPHARGVMKETYLKVISEDISQQLSFIKVLSVIIWGDKDNITPIGQAHFINKKINNSKLVIIPGGNHDLEIKTSEILAEKILENL